MTMQCLGVLGSICIHYRHPYPTCRDAIASKKFSGEVWVGVVWWITINFDVCSRSTLDLTRSSTILGGQQSMFKQNYHDQNWGLLTIGWSYYQRSPTYRMGMGSRAKSAHCGRSWIWYNYNILDTTHTDYIILAHIILSVGLVISLIVFIMEKIKHHLRVQN